MFKKMNAGMFLLLGVLLVSGCATSRNYQSDIDSLNSRISALQGQLSAKDEEIARMQNQSSVQQTALAQAEADKRALSAKLEQLEAKRPAKQPQTHPK